eukprot:808687-Alexandrium_andersonii.AAC.1
MSASLVGSEMCIRDSRPPLGPLKARGPHARCRPFAEWTAPRQPVNGGHQRRDVVRAAPKGLSLIHI